MDFFVGAKAVLIGRPILWGLSHGGEDGVKKVLEFFKNDFEDCMKSCGASSIKELNMSLLSYKYTSKM